VRRELVAHPPVELLDRADQPEVAFLDQIEERDTSLRVVARDRHDEAQVAFDEPPLRFLVTFVLALGKLALLRRRQQATVADLADIELERVLDGRRLVERVYILRYLRIRLVECP